MRLFFVRKEKRDSDNKLEMYFLRKRRRKGVVVGEDIISGRRLRNSRKSREFIFDWVPTKQNVTIIDATSVQCELVQ